MTPFFLPAGWVNAQFAARANRTYTSNDFYRDIVADFGRHSSALRTGQTVGNAAPYASLIMVAAMTPVGSAIIIETGLAAKDTAVISWNASVSVANAAAVNAEAYYATGIVLAGSPAGRTWIQRGTDFFSNWNPGEHGVFSPPTRASLTGLLVNQLTER